MRIAIIGAGNVGVTLGNRLGAKSWPRDFLRCQKSNV
jgi:predicted dinucleotide-binding enzyme